METTHWQPGLVKKRELSRIISTQRAGGLCPRHFATCLRGRKAAATPVDTKSTDMNFPETSRHDPRQGLWTTTELARFLGCTERHIYHLRQRGLPTIRLGTLVRFDPAEALNWLERRGKTSKLSDSIRGVAAGAEAAGLREGPVTP